MSDVINPLLISLHQLLLPLGPGLCSKGTCVPQATITFGQLEKLTFSYKVNNFCWAPRIAWLGNLTLRIPDCKTVTDCNIQKIIQKIILKISIHFIFYESVDTQQAAIQTAANFVLIFIPYRHPSYRKDKLTSVITACPLVRDLCDNGP